MKIHERQYAMVEVFVFVGIFVYLCMTYMIVNYIFGDSSLISPQKVTDGQSGRPDSKKKKKSKRD